MNNQRTRSKQGEALYEIREETPTITFVGATDVLTLPYHAFRWMRRDPSSGTIQIEIDDLRISLQGERLRDLWRALQLFQVREVHENGNEETPSTMTPAVHKILIKKIEEGS